MLGPIFFLIYANSIAVGCDNSWYSFADDFKLYASYSRGDDMGIDKLQADLDIVVATSEAWNLRLNTSKCVVMRFGSGSSQVVVGSGSGYFLGNSELVLVGSHRDLGVTVDCSLKFHCHVSSVVNRAGGLVGQLLRGTVCREMSFMVTLFVSHIRPLLDYCAPVWNVGYRGDMRRLEAVQRRWLREIEGMAHLEYSERLRRCELYSVCGRMVRADLIKVWKIFHGFVDEELIESSHPVTRGHEFKVSIPRCRTEVRRRSFEVRVVDLWNGLPEFAVQLDTCNKFKAYLDENLCEMFYGEGF